MCCNCLLRRKNRTLIVLTEAGATIQGFTVLHVMLHLACKYYNIMDTKISSWTSQYGATITCMSTVAFTKTDCKITRRWKNSYGEYLQGINAHAYDIITPTRIKLFSTNSVGGKQSCGDGCSDMHYDQ